MPYCTICGTSNDDDAIFCNHCGKKIESGEKESFHPKTGKMTLKYSIITIIVLVITYGLYTGVNHYLLDSPISIYTKTKKQESVNATSDVLSDLPDIVNSKEQNVNQLKIDRTGLNSRLNEVELSNKYSYSSQNCNQLITDVFQGVCYSIQQELVEVTKISEKEENSIGRDLAKIIRKEYKGTIDKDAKWTRYFRSLGKSLIKKVNRKGISYHFHVINSDVPNAFAIPGGGIYIFKGLLNSIENEAQLVAIIAHEIKHVDLRHCIALFQVVKDLPEAVQNPMIFFLRQIVMHPYNSRVEADADRRSLELIYSYGYSPYQIVRYWENLKTEKSQNENSIFGGILGRISKEVENVLSTHPEYPKRVCLLKNHILKLSKTYPFEFFYIGKWNFNHRQSMFNVKK